MLPQGWVRGFDTRRLRRVLLALFAALALPTALLVWQAWGQLKWEAYHQYRGDAEVLTRRIDARLAALVAGLERRSFADFAFLLEPAAGASNVVQRSPLSGFPVDAELPGLIGYFQVDSEGRFSTPLLPASAALVGELGIGADEYVARRTLAENIRAVLADNRLVQARAPGMDVAPPADSMHASPAVPPAEPEPKARNEYSQEAFDELSRNKRTLSDLVSTVEQSAESAAYEQRLEPIAKVSDISLDEELQDKSKKAERENAAGASRDLVATAARQRADNAPAPAAGSPGALREDDSAGLASSIATFASEIDTYDFGLLGSGHFVLFRNVWRDGERYVQGLLIDGPRFVAEAIGSGYTSDSLAARSSLIVAYDDDVIATYTSDPARGRLDSEVAQLGGTLLYRSRLSAPLDHLELIYSATALPPGPGGRLLLWLSAVLALVFLGGFTVLYRLGASQIRLARQQQDFVSAVSHELKTPLTSIRMYGEMLMQGWADDAKRQTYYEYIHDEAERLSRLIANVLQLASITRNEPQLNLRPVRVRELMDTVESRITNQVERAGFALRVRRADEADEAVVTVDADCFLQVLINLVDNALKFSRNAENRLVEIDCRLSGKQVRFSVRDYGPGVPKDQMHKIFQLFYRSESELTRETVGTGIGLAIVHQLTTAMGGSVDLVNAEPGAEFRLLFPIAPQT